MRAIGTVLAPEGSSVTVRGHTNSLQWKPGDAANNWSLSAGRAETTRQAFIGGAAVKRKALPAGSKASPIRTP